MKITGGSARGRSIAVPEGHSARPTASKVRQALFNIVSSKMGGLEGLRLLDICAGTGIMGMEALSRGAARVTFVEESRAMGMAIEKTLRKFGYESEVIFGDLRKTLPVLEGEKYDLVFADPPYQSSLHITVLKLLAQYSLVGPNSLIAFERARSRPIATEEELIELNFACLDERHYGQTTLSFFRLR